MFNALLSACSLSGARGESGGAHAPVHPHREHRAVHLERRTGAPSARTEGGCDDRDGRRELGWQRGRGPATSHKCMSCCDCIRVFIDALFMFVVCVSSSSNLLLCPSFDQLPVLVILRLCTEESDVVEYWNNIDNQLELDIDVLDDLLGDARQVQFVRALRVCAYIVRGRGCASSFVCNIC